MVNKSLLNETSIEITPKFILRIPTVREVLENEEIYYNITSSLTAAPYQFMVQLDDWGIDYTKINHFDLFRLLFPFFAKKDLSIIFDNWEPLDFVPYVKQVNNKEEKILYDKKNGLEINELIYNNLADTIRKINSYEKVYSKPGNEHAKKYVLDNERKRLKRLAKKKKESNLEKKIVALVNTSEFPYDYDSCMNLSIYRFNQSFAQIQKKITYDNIMTGVYMGTVDTKKMKNKDILSWIPIN